MAKGVNFFFQTESSKRLLGFPVVDAIDLWKKRSKDGRKVPADDAFVNDNQQ